MFFNSRLFRAFHFAARSFLREGVAGEPPPPTPPAGGGQRVPRFVVIDHTPDKPKRKRRRRPRPQPIYETRGLPELEPVVLPAPLLVPQIDPGRLLAMIAALQAPPVPPEDFTEEEEEMQILQYLLQAGF